MNNDMRDASQDMPSSSAEVIVIIDGKRIALTREQEALIRSWATGPV